MGVLENSNLNAGLENPGHWNCGDSVGNWIGLLSNFPFFGSSVCNY